MTCLSEAPKTSRQTKLVDFDFEEPSSQTTRDLKKQDKKATYHHRAIAN